MNLQEFVKDVLIGLDKAIENARQETKRDIRFSETQNQRTVEFDIAVAVEEKDAKSGKAGIRVLQFVEGKGDMSRESKNSTVSRIKFGVRIETWTKEEQARQEIAFRNSNKEEFF